MQAPLFGIGLKSRSAAVTAKRLINCYLEYRPMGEKVQVVAHGFYGTTEFCDIGAQPVRGAPITVNDIAYCVIDNDLWSINNAGIATSLGAINSSLGFIEMATDGDTILIVDGTDGYLYNVSGATLSDIRVGDADFPTNPITCTWLRGFYLVGKSNGEMYWSIDGSSWASLDFVTAEESPDKLVSIISDHGQVIVFGELSTEFWVPVADTTAPFQPITGAGQEWGCAAQGSVVKFDNSIMLLIRNQGGEVSVGQLMGNSIVRVSTPDVDNIINGYTVKGDAKAMFFMMDGHPMYQITFPAANETWVYDGLTKHWYNRKTQGLSRHRHQFAVQLVDKTLFTDYTNGKVYKLDKDAVTEANDERIELEIVGEHWDRELSRFEINNIRVDAETGLSVTPERETLHSGTLGAATTASVLALAADAPSDIPSNAKAIATIKRDKHVYLPGVNGNHLSIFGTPATYWAGDTEVVAKVAADAWTGAQQYIMGRYASMTSAGLSLRIESSGVLGVDWVTTGLSYNSEVSTAAVPFSDTDAGYIKVTLDVDNGASGYDVTFYTSTDGVTWTQLGDVVTGSGTTDIMDPSLPIVVGNYTTGSGAPFAGKVFFVKIYDGIGGTLEYSANAEDATPGDTSFASTETGETWTVASSGGDPTEIVAAVSDTQIRGVSSYDSATRLLTMSSPFTAFESGDIGPSGAYQVVVDKEPQIMLQISKDGGENWGAERWRSLGRVGANHRVEWRRNGQAKRWTIKFRITDAVKKTIMGCYVDPND